MSNHTKPSRAAYGDIRFPPNDRGAGDIVTYTMSKEEMRARYGVPLNERISRAELFRLKGKRNTYKQIADMYGVTEEQVRALMQFYRARM